MFRRMMTARRLLLRLLVTVPVILFAIWLGSLAAVVLAARRDQARPAAAIIVMGAAQYVGRPSPVLRARLDHAIQLWHQGLAPRLIVTGGKGQGDVISEADVSRRYALRRGVPDSVILLENRGRTTSESFRGAVALLRTDHARSDREKTVDDRYTAILVSDPFHMLRLGVLARRHGLVPYLSPTPTSPISASPRLAWQYMLRESVKVPFVFVTENPR
jgi:uncharacterized SAM-binding protein YcdF (DUF218 family)